METTTLSDYEYTPATPEQIKACEPPDVELPPAMVESSRRALEIIAKQPPVTREMWEAQIRTHFYGE